MQIRMEPKQLPASVYGLKVKYKLAFEGDEECGETVFEGVKQFNNYLCCLQMDASMFMVARECKMQLEIEILEIYFNSSYDRILDRNQWNEYGFV